MSTQELCKDTSYDGLLIYADGSSDQKKKIIGWGVHGYLYQNALPKKGTGHPKVVPTATGYLLKQDAKDIQVTPMGYFNIIGATTEEGSNNTAEVKGIVDGLKVAKDYRIKNITIRTDSEYAINGFTKWSPTWISQNWIKRDGTEVANKETWKEALSLYSTLKDNGVKITFKWVKGHSGEFGNTLVDNYAAIGRAKSTAGDNESIVTTHAPDGYFKVIDNRHPFVIMRSVFFSTDPNVGKTGCYAMTNMSKTEEFVGRNDTNAAVAYIELKEPIPIIELVRERQKELANDLPSLVLMRYDRLFEQNRDKDIMNFGKSALVRHNSKRVDLFFISDKSFREEPEKQTPITEDLVPIMLADRANKAANQLEGVVKVMKEYISQPDAPVKGASVFDISDALFQKKTKTKGNTTTTEWDVAEAVTPTAKELVLRRNCRGVDTDYKLVFGLHLPTRNNLKKFCAGKDLRAWLVVRYESEDAERFMVVIYLDGEWLACSAYCSNLVIRGEQETVVA